MKVAEKMFVRSCSKTKDEHKVITRQLFKHKYLHANCGISTEKGIELLKLIHQSLMPYHLSQAQFCVSHQCLSARPGLTSTQSHKLYISLQCIVSWYHQSIKSTAKKQAF